MIFLCTAYDDCYSIGHDVGLSFKKYSNRLNDRRDPIVDETVNVIYKQTEQEECHIIHDLFMHRLWWLLQYCL